MNDDTREYVPCGLCGKPTPMLGTKRCNPCWELEQRVKYNPGIAIKILQNLGYIIIRGQK